MVNCCGSMIYCWYLSSHILCLTIFFYFLPIFFSNVSVQILIVFFHFYMFLHRNTNIRNTSTWCNGSIPITSCSTIKIPFGIVSIISVISWLCIVALVCISLCVWVTCKIFFKSSSTPEGGCGHPCQWR